MTSCLRLGYRFVWLLRSDRWRSVDGLGLLAVLVIAVAIAYTAHSRMEGIRAGLAPQLFDQHLDIVALEVAAARLNHLIERARRVTVNADSVSDTTTSHSVNLALGEVTTILATMRRTYSFDSVAGASAAHALMRPAVDDLSRWLVQGVHGYQPTSVVVMELAYRRVHGALVELSALREQTVDAARRLLSAESENVDQLRREFIIAIVILALLAMGFAVAIMHQRNAARSAGSARVRLVDALDMAAHGIAVFDSQDRLLHCNARFALLYPGDVEALQPGLSFSKVASALTIALRDEAAAIGWRGSTLIAPRASAGPLLIDLDRGRCVQAEVRPTSEGGTALVHTDVSEWCRITQRLSYLATHDSLTELPARAHFESRLQQALNTAGRFGQELYVMFIDVDAFKLVNDTLGHAAGDTVLVAVAGRLRASLRTQDVVGRLSGDEFAVFLENTTGFAEARATAQRMLDNVALPIEIDGQEFRQTISLGIAQYPSDATTPRALLQCADAACYRAKHLGRNGASVYATPS
jgi:diguanylate cyclase (GGDEF)-like protein